MSTTRTPLLAGNWYHIYNRGINGERLFLEDMNYSYFLKLLVKHVLNEAEVYSYCLLSNHFHLLVRIIDQPEKQPHLGFSQLFNSYTQAINKRYKRTGSLFERPFRRKLIESEQYRAKLVCYIHRNPQHHGILNDFQKYPYSSYMSLLSLSPCHLKRKQVLGWFGGREGFVAAHQGEFVDSDIEDYIIE